jgi:hypothetical protein
MCTASKVPFPVITGSDRIAAAMAPRNVTSTPGPTPPYHDASANAEKNSRKGETLPRKGRPQILIASAATNARIETPNLLNLDLSRLCTPVFFPGYFYLKT